MRWGIKKPLENRKENPLSNLDGPKPKQTGSIQEATDYLPEEGTSLAERAIATIEPLN